MSRWLPRIDRPGGGGSGPTPPPGGSQTLLLWNANGDLAAFPAQPSSFDGLLVTDPLIVGDGPFDSQRVLGADVTVSALNIIQRCPGAAQDVTEVEFYLLRGGVVTSMGTVSLNNTSNMQQASSVPAVANLLAGDVLFVSFVSVPALDGACDLTAFLSL